MLTILLLKIAGLQLLMSLQTTPNVPGLLKTQIETVADLAINFKESDITPTIVTQAPQTVPTQVQIVGSIPLQASTSPINTPAPTPVVTYTPPMQTPSIAFTKEIIANQYGEGRDKLIYHFTLKDGETAYTDYNTRPVKFEIYVNGEKVLDGNAKGTWTYGEMASGNYRMVFHYKTATIEDSVTIN